VISPSRIVKALLISFTLAASAYGIAKLNMFGLEGMSDRIADGVYQRITAADYGADRKGQQAVSVVYLDEAGVDNLKGFGWTRFPPTYEQQWTMMDDVLQAGGAPPAGVFVDFVYLGQGGPAEGFETFRSGVANATRAAAWKDNKACTADPLMRISCIVAAGGTPMIFARPSAHELDLFTDVQKALDEVSVLSPALVRTEAYPVITRYPDMPPAQARALGVHGFDVSPAAAMYVAWCMRHDGCGVKVLKDLKAAGMAALAGRRAVSPDVGKVFDYPLDVVWGSRPDPDYLRMTKAVSGQPPACRGTSSGLLGRFWEQFQAARGPGSGHRQECPYQLSLGYDRMVAGVGLQAEDLQKLLAGRLVMVGGQFRASNDWVDSPVHGQAPGVYFHAMALDNLIESDADYRRNTDFSGTFFDSDLLKSTLIFGLAFFGIIGVMVRNSLHDRAVEMNLPPRLRSHIYGPLYLSLFLACIAVIALATELGVQFGRRAPINWIGIGFVSLGFLCYAVRETLPQDICGSLDELPLARRILRLLGQCKGYLKFEEERLLPPKPKPAARGPLDAAPGEAVSQSDPAPVAPPASPTSTPPLEEPVHVQA
jgi:hypothetical protein